MRLIAKVIRISHDKFHCNRLRGLQLYKITRVSFLGTLYFEKGTLYYRYSLFGLRSVNRTLTTSKENIDFAVTS